MIIRITQYYSKLLHITPYYSTLLNISTSQQYSTLLNITQLYLKVCKTYLCPDCTRKGPEECQTVYDTVCETKRKVHEVEDDVVNCETVVEEKCENVLDGEQL